jgi:WD40 repeat protein
MYQQQSRSELQDSASYTLLADTERLVLACMMPINESALQVYHSAVATMPSCLLWETLGQHCADIPLLVSQRASGWGPRVRIIYEETDVAVFSPDGRFILSHSGAAQLWDVATGTQLYHTSNTHSCTAIAFSPDGQNVLYGFFDGTVEVWAIATWAKQTVLPRCSNAEVKAVTFTPDSQSVVSAFEDGTVQVWTQQTQKVFTTGCSFFSPAALSDVEVVFSRNWEVVFSLDCRFMAATACDGEYAARVWTLIPGASPEPLVIAGLTDKAYFAAAFSPDGSTVAFGAMDGIHVWDTTTSTQRMTINGHSSRVTAIAFSRDGQFLVSGSEDKTIMVWNFSAGAQQPDYVLKGHSGIVLSVAFSPDAKLVVSSSQQDPMRVWSGAVSVDESVMEGDTYVIKTIVFSHDGRHIASGSEDSTIRVWDAGTGRQKYVLEGHEDEINRVVFSPNSQTIASCSRDRTVRLWDVATGTQVHAVLHHPWTPDAVVFSHNGQSILAINNYTRGEMRGALEAYVWEVATGTQKCVISCSPSQLSPWDPSPVIFSPSDQLVISTLHSDTDSSWSGRSDKEATDYKVWDVSTGVELAVHDLTPTLARDMDDALLSRNEQAVAPYRTGVSDGWIEVSQHEGDWHRVCWLPAERLPMLPWYPYASHGQKVCVGAGNGAVTTLDFSNVPMPWMR